MASIVPVKDIVKTAAAIDEMSKEITFNKCQFQRLRSRINVISSVLDSFLTSGVNPDEMKTILQNLNETLRQFTKFIQKFLNTSELDRYMKNFEYQERFTMFNDLLFCNSLKLNVPMGICQLFDEQDDIADQYSDLSDVSSKIVELGLKMAHHQKELFHTLTFTKGEFYRHAVSFKFRLQQDIKKAQSSDFAKKTENERNLFLHIPGYDLIQQEKIGQGSFGDVYHGKWLSRYHDVAIKVIHVNNITDTAKEGFLKEIKTMYQIRYEHVLSILGVCMESNYYALVMEYMPLGSLYNLLKNKTQTLAWSVRWSLALQMSKAINYLHMASILHRGIKSSNFLIEMTPAGYLVKVADFSLAQIRSESTRQMRSNNSGRMPPGTVRWTAPELFDADKSSMASDIFSLGMVFWEVATRCIPYEDVNDTVIVVAISAGKRPVIPADVPSTFAGIISDSWNQEPRRRPTCRELIQRLETNVSMTETRNAALPYPTTATNFPFQTVPLQYTNNTLRGSNTLHTPYTEGKKVITTVENNNEYCSNKATESIDRTTFNVEPLVTRDKQAHRVTIAVHDFMLYDTCPIYDDDDYANIFVAINFLNYPTVDLRIPEGSAKEKALTGYSFNFQKDYSILDPEQQTQLAALVAPNSSGEIRFDVIAEPCNKNKTLYCIEIGYATVDVKRLLRTSSDCVDDSIEIMSAKEDKSLIGQIGITVVIIEALKLALRQVHRAQNSGAEYENSTERHKEHHSHVENHFSANDDYNNESEETDNELLALFTQLMDNDTNESCSVSRCNSSVSRRTVSDSSNCASRLRLAAIRARIEGKSNPRRSHAVSKTKTPRSRTPGRSDTRARSRTPGRSRTPESSRARARSRTPGRSK